MSILDTPGASSITATATAIQPTDLLAFLSGGIGGTLEGAVPAVVANALGSTMPAANAAPAALTDTLWVNQGGASLVVQTLSALVTLVQSQASSAVQKTVVVAGGSVLLDASTHNNAHIIFTAPGSISPPAAYASFGNGCSCDVTNLSGGNVTFTTTASTNTGGIVTSGVSVLPNLGMTRLKSTTALGSLGTIVLSTIGSSTVANSMTINSVTGTVPGGTSTLAFSFSGAAPTSITATAAGSALTLSGISINGTAGSGSATFTTPAAGTYAIVVTGTGANTSSSSAYSLTTAVAPTMTITSITGTIPGGTSTANFSFGSGTPTSVTATLDGSALSIAGISIGATTGSFTFTTPAAGTHPVIVTGTGANTASSAPYSLTTAVAPSITVTSVTGLSAGGTATANFSYTSTAPTSVTAKVDGATITIAAITISGGVGSFTFTAPAAGSHTLVVTETGAATAVSPSYGFTTTVANPYSVAIASSHSAITALGTYSNQYQWMTLSGGSPTSVDVAFGPSNTSPPAPGVSGAAGQYISGGGLYSGYYAPALGIGANLPSPTPYYVWFIITDANGTFDLLFNTISVGNTVTAAGGG